jgi:acetyl-CoA C-acetyltransferase
MIDCMMFDGLTDIFNRYHMGITAENVAEKYGISREDQDAFAVASQNKAEAAIKEGRLPTKSSPWSSPSGRATPTFDTDEHPRLGATIEGVSKIPPGL